MMKNLLNNPLVVALLAMVAVGVVYMQVLDPILHSPNQLASLNAEFTDAVHEPNHAVSDTRANFGWSPAMFNSNPFASRQSLGNGQQGQFQETSAEQEAENIYKLSAILIGAKQPMAWVGGKLVGIGDVVGDMRVAAIESELVLLRGKKGKRILKLSSAMAGGSHHE